MSSHLVTLGGDRIVTLSGDAIIVGAESSSGSSTFVRGARWTWALGGTPTTGVGAQRELTRAYGRTVTWRLDATDTAQFSIDGNSDEIANWARLATDLYVRRDGDLLHRGRLAPEQGTIDENRHAVQITSIGYRGMLDTHYIGTPAPTYTAVAQGAIAWDLINTTQLRTNGTLGITDGIGTGGGVARTRKDYIPGKPIGEAVSELGRVDNGFEWEIDADLALNRWYPRRGFDNGVVLDFPGRITRIDYSFDPATFSNAPMALGDQNTTPVVATSPTIGSDARGRWERATASPTVTDQTTVTARAAFLLAQQSVIKLAYRVTLRPGTWGGPSDVWLGDTVALAVKKGRVFENMTPHRVTEINATPGENGTESIQMVLVAA
jgi:hypothetical protein